MIMSASKESDNPKIWGRVIKSVIVLVIAGVIRTVMSPVAMIGAGAAAGGQLVNSDSAAVASMTQMAFFSGLGGWLSLVVFVLLFIIWWPLIVRAFNTIKEA